MINGISRRRFKKRLIACNLSCAKVGESVNFQVAGLVQNRFCNDFAGHESGVIVDLVNGFPER